MYTEMKAKVWSNKGWIEETDPGLLHFVGYTLLEEVGFRILGFTDHHFKPQGYTALWLLGESHLAIHTFPEEGLTYYELTSCNPEKQDMFMKSWFPTLPKKV